MGMESTPSRRRRGCTCHPGMGGIGLQVQMHSSERPMDKTGSSVGRSRCHDRPAHSLSLTKRPHRLNELAPFSLTKPRQVLSQRKNCKQQTQAPVRAHAHKHPRLQEHLARYRDGARVSRRNDRLQAKHRRPPRGKLGAALKAQWRGTWGRVAERGVMERGRKGERGRGKRQTCEGQSGEGRSKGATDSGRKGATAARTPTKSTVVHPHLSAVSCAPIT